MESAVRTVCEPIFDRPLKDISFGRILLRLFEISRRFNMQIQPQLILLQKTLLNVEGLGRELYPDLDIWSTASPILREWMRERTSVRALVHELRTHAPQLIAAARGLPRCCRAWCSARPARRVRRLPPLRSASCAPSCVRPADATRLPSAWPISARAVLAGTEPRPEWPGWVLLAAGVGIVAYGLRR